ncbi:6-carboxytetrahydropterin synthase QueD [Mannheimia sp. E30BD]|uniref:6-carboxytetrahydropterin synthase QueD n=1 Tax=Mannheimia sp. E30BD TaxID=3278708 RepID=UPI00359EA9DF
MFKIAKEFSFDMAHMLDGHDGKCQNLHGHTYKLQVEVAGELFQEGAKRGMLMDYSDLKAIVKTHILDSMDHAFIYDLHNERESQVAQFISPLALSEYIRININAVALNLQMRFVLLLMVKYKHFVKR